MGRLFLPMLGGLIGTLVFTQPAQANVPLQGELEATQACAALRSIKRQDNPGNVVLEVGKRYPLRAQNRAQNPSYYQVFIRGIKSPNRWVPAECGSRGFKTPDTVSKPKPEPVLRDFSNTQKRPTRLTLAVTWQPTFCENKRRVKECKTQTSGRYDATHFSLHGLWPEPKENTYCDVSKRLKNTDRASQWRDLPALTLSAKTRQRLDQSMPGTASYLQRHEWIKHGTCYSKQPEAYYVDSLKLMDELNRSEVQALFARSLGKKLKVTQVQAAFDRSFGKGAGKKITLRCDKKKRISEIYIHLKGDGGDMDDLSTMLKRARQSKRRSCEAGWVDRAGY